MTHMGLGCGSNEAAIRVALCTAALLVNVTGRGSRARRDVRRFEQACDRGSARGPRFLPGARDDEQWLVFSCDYASALLWIESVEEGVYREGRRRP